MLPIKFQLNPTNSLRGDVLWRISRMQPWGPSWIAKRNDFSNSVFLYRSNASHQILAQSDLLFWRCLLKNFKMAAILDIGTEWFYQLWISMSLLCLPSSFSFIRLTVWEMMLFEEFQDGHHGSHLGYRNGTILAILDFYVALMSPTNFWLNLTYGLGGDVVKRTARWPPWQPSWILEWNHFSNSESPFCNNTSH